MGLDRKEIESMRRMHERNYQEDNPTAVVVVEFGQVDYDTCPTVKDYQERGYRLYDANAFGNQDGCVGEFLVFIKDK